MERLVQGVGYAEGAARRGAEGYSPMRQARERAGDDRRREPQVAVKVE